MSRWACELIIGCVAFVVAMLFGYGCWRSRKMIAPEPVETGEIGLRARVLALTPVVFGSICGFLLVALFARWIVAGDKFYTAHSAVRSTVAIALGALLIVGPELVMAITCRQAPRWKWIADLVALIIAAIVVVAAGVRFRVIGVGGEGDVELGRWAAPLTVLWLVLAVYIVRLLDGLEGASNVLLLVCSVAIFYVTLRASEPFLNSFAVAVIGASLASLRFNFFPARLPLRGSGTAFIGFIFAVLTVLARQKTVAALLLIFPLFVVIVLVGGAMLALLERTMSAGDSE